MKVIVYVNYLGNTYNWDELNPDEKKEISEKLNDQMAKRLGYRRKAPRRVPADSIDSNY